MRDAMHSGRNHKKTSQSSLHTPSGWAYLRSNDGYARLKQVFASSAACAFLFISEVLKYPAVVACKFVIVVIALIYLSWIVLSMLSGGN